ncbi:Uncharacterized protein Fot_24278 [Forsythia ovata]|uniref:AIR9-like A9 domain-containing protein n=1 Tax=Forsythia ovata TaxID=205694 RepID=A0ABD1U702_9LAMI
MPNQTSSDGTHIEITGATASSYMLSVADIGYFISVSCEPVRSDWTRGPIVLSEQVGPIVPAISKYVMQDDPTYRGQNGIRENRLYKIDQSEEGKGQLNSFFEISIFCSYFCDSDRSVSCAGTLVSREKRNVIGIVMGINSRINKITANIVITGDSNRQDLQQA